jgi:hypothetical protein
MDPVLEYLLPIAPESATLRQWTRSHDYDVWTDCRAQSEPPLTLWEGRGRGVLRIPDEATLMHVVSAGVPHHVEHLFGYWRQSDSDLVWLRATREGWTHYAMVVGGSPAAYKMDRILWICPACGETMGQHEFATGPHALERFWRGERAAVSDFNAAPEKRTCPSCGHLHPPAYEFLKPGAAAPEMSW